MNKTHERCKDNQNHGLNIKKLNTNNSQNAQNCVPKPERKLKGQNSCI